MVTPCDGCPFKACDGCRHQGGPVVDTATAAVAAGVEPATIRDWARRGILPRVSRGRYHLAAVYRAKNAVRRVSSYTTKPLATGDEQ